MAATQHDDFYKRLRDKVTRWADQQKIPADLRDYLLAAPDLFHLLCRLVMDQRVAGREKALLGVGIAYVLSPIDLIPDVFGPIGFVDDLIVMVIILDSVLKRVPRSIVDEHWAGTGDLLRLVRESLDKADSWVGKGLFRRIRTWLEDQGVLSRSAGTKTAAAPPPPARKTATKKTAKKTTARKTAAKKATTRKTAAKKTGAKKTARKAGSRKSSSKTIGPARSGGKTGGRS
jgi:uncharacterized membrane protein YkvA (DUF1232 family)